MKMKFTLTLFGLMAFAGQVRAADSGQDELSRIEALENKVDELERRLDRVRLGPIARNPNGSVRRMTRGQAVSYCANRGGLPTIKQLALALNFKGTSYLAREDYYHAIPNNEASFYYTIESYKRPSGDEGSEWFWSSSTFGGPSFWAFAGDDGGIGYGGPDIASAVRCVAR